MPLCRARCFQRFGHLPFLRELDLSSRCQGDQTQQPQLPETHRETTDGASLLGTSCPQAYCGVRSGQILTGRTTVHLPHQRSVIATHRSTASTVHRRDQCPRPCGLSGAPHLSCGCLQPTADRLPAGIEPTSTTNKTT